MPYIRTISGDKGHIKRPGNAWIFFRSAMLTYFQSPLPGQPRLPQAVISGKVSKMWKEATPEVRAVFEEMSRRAHAEHRAKYPDYKFRPMKKEEKMRLRKEREEEKKAQRQRTRGKASKTRRNDHRDPPPPLLTTTPLPGAALPIPSMGHASSLFPRDAIVAPPVVPSQNGFSTQSIQPAGRAPITIPTPSTQCSTPSASPPGMLPTLRLSPYSPPGPAFDTQMVAPQHGMPQYTPPSASTWQQPSPPYSQPQQQQQADYGVPPTALHSETSSLDFSAYEVPAQQAGSGVSPATLHSQTSSLDFSEYEVPTQRLTIPVPAQLVQNPTEWDPNSLDSSFPYMPINENPTNDPLCFVFGTGECFDDEQIFDDPRGIQVDGSALDPNSFGFLSSLGSTGSFDGSMGNTVPQGDIQDFSDLFDSLIQDDVTNVAGPSRPLDPPPSGNVITPEMDQAIASILRSLEQEDALDAAAASGVQTGSSFLASEAQPEVAQPVANSYVPTYVPTYVPAYAPPAPAYAPPVPAYVPPAGAMQSSTRRVGADWRHRRVSAESDVAMS